MINTIFGAVINENLNDEIIVTVIATGFDQHKDEPLHQAPSQSDDIFGADDDGDIPNFLRSKRVF